MISALFNRSNTTPNLQSITWTLRLSGVLIAGIFLGGGWFGHHALQRYADTLDNQHQGAVCSIRDATRIESKHRALEHQVHAAVLRRDAAAERVPAAANEIEFLRQLSSIARDCQLEIREFRPGATSDFTTHSEMEFFIRGEGDFASLCRFIASLKDMPRVCRVAQMTVAAPAKGTEISQIELHISLAFGLKPLVPTSASRTGENG